VTGGHVVVQRRYRWGGQPIHQWSAWSTIATLTGTSSQYVDYTFDQAGVGPDTLQYRIQVSDNTAKLSVFSDVVTLLYNHIAQKPGLAPLDTAIPIACEFWETYPNPFNPSTTLRFGLPTAGDVSLIVYDVLGREITTLVKGTLNAGYHTATWNASSVASGVYFARLTMTNDFGKVAFNKVTKLLLMK
jgi:Secretion system C-terminal sorting domain